MRDPPKILGGWIAVPVAKRRLAYVEPCIDTKKKREDQRERVRRKKMQARKKVGKSRFTVFFPMICGSGGSKSRLAKATDAEPSGQMRDEKLHAVVVRSTLGNIKLKTAHVRTTFGS